MGFFESMVNGAADKIHELKDYENRMNEADDNYLAREFDRVSGPRKAIVANILKERGYRIVDGELVQI